MNTSTTTTTATTTTDTHIIHHGTLQYKQYKRSMLLQSYKSCYASLTKHKLLLYNNRYDYNTWQPSINTIQLSDIQSIQPILQQSHWYTRNDSNKSLRIVLYNHVVCDILTANSVECKQWYDLISTQINNKPATYSNGTDPYLPTRSSHNTNDELLYNSVNKQQLHNTLYQPNDIISHPIAEIVQPAVQYTFAVSLTLHESTAFHCIHPFITLSTMNDQHNEWHELNRTEICHTDRHSGDLITYTYNIMLHCSVGTQHAHIDTYNTNHQLLRFDLQHQLNVDTMHLLGTAHSTLSDIISPQSNKTITLPVMFLPTAGDELIGELHVQHCTTQPVMTSNIKYRFCYHSYIIEPNIIINESLIPTPFNFILPYYYLKLMLYHSSYDAEHTAIYNTLVELYGDYNGRYKNMLYKQSRCKADAALQFIPINCNTQIIHTAQQQYIWTTVGAWTDHCDSFKYGSIDSLIQQCKLLYKKVLSHHNTTEYNQLNELLSILHHRWCVVRSQALTSIATSITSLLCSTTSLTQNILHTGVLVVIQSLLSTWSNELHMLYDTNLAVQSLSNVTVQIECSYVQSTQQIEFNQLHNAIYNTRSYLSHNEHDIDINCLLDTEYSSILTKYDIKQLPRLPTLPAVTIHIVLPQSIYQHIHTQIIPVNEIINLMSNVNSDGLTELNINSIHHDITAQSIPLLHIVPIIFTQGINEMQSLSNRLHKSQYQHDINKYSLQQLLRYIHEYQFSSSNLKSQCNEKLQMLNELITHKYREKCIDVLYIAADICRLLSGCNIISCKSAKDRTSMLITRQQSQLIASQYNMNNDDIDHMTQLYRQYGVRRDNVFSNTGQWGYAFNRLQRSLLPPTLCPTTDLCNSNAQA